MKNVILITLGIISLSIGAVGIFIPVLPTTPLVLLSAGCFSAGSPRLYSLLTKNRYFGSYINSYREHTGVPTKVVIWSLAVLWSGLLLSMLLIGSLPIIIILIAIGSGVTLHLVYLLKRGR